MRSYRRALAEHPNLIPLLSEQTMTAGSVLVGYDRVAGLLGTAGFPEEQVMLWVSVLDSYALGAALDLAASDEGWRASGGTPRLWTLRCERHRTGGRGPTRCSSWAWRRCSSGCGAGCPSARPGSDPPRLGSLDGMGDRRADTHAKQSCCMLLALGTVHDGCAGVSMGPEPGVHDGVLLLVRWPGWLSAVRRGTPAG